MKLKNFEKLPTNSDPLYIHANYILFFFSYQSHYSRGNIAIFENDILEIVNLEKWLDDSATIFRENFCQTVYHITIFDEGLFLDKTIKVTNLEKWLGDLTFPPSKKPNRLKFQPKKNWQAEPIAQKAWLAEHPVQKHRIDLWSATNTSSDIHTNSF